MSPQQISYCLLVVVCPKVILIQHLAGAVSEEETTLARNQLRTALYQQLESNTGKAEFNAKELLYTGSVRSLADLENQIASIDQQALRNAVFNHVYDRDTANVGVGKHLATFPLAVG
ncbi:unnamed protein product [Strongylus vulgaris]|uniref:Uncharacterized protein n=1 Tax=Strongylus vulgaris TaxID=40348 RepID=A0A3P7K7N8_STRVU|nr:unnamed protein product [Strongylus vulgaris]